MKHPLIAISLGISIFCDLINYMSTEVTRENGHYPPDFCTITDVVFDHKRKTFLYESESDDHSKCTFCSIIWPIKNQQLSYDKFACDETFDIGYAFTTFYWVGTSNYYHLHKDMMMPLYKHFYYEKNKDKNLRVAFMPTVESSRLKELAWDTLGFQDEQKYWYQTVKAIAGKHTILPLDEMFLKRNKFTCFRKIHFGAARVDFFDKTFRLSFIQHIKSVYNIKSMGPTYKYKIGLISRAKRRRVLNELELIKYMSGKVDLIEFSGMSVKDQIQLMQEYEVLIGMNGAGLMNGIYLPPHGAVVQLVPYKAGLNFDWYGRFMRVRGPYVEWHNEHEENTREFQGDKYRNHPDTIIKPEEFNATVYAALAEVNKHIHLKDEL